MRAKVPSSKFQVPNKFQTPNFKYLLTNQQARDLDRYSEELGVTTSRLMQNAGLEIAQVLMRLVAPGEGPVIFFCGKGNNGGDGRVAATILKRKKYSVALIDEKSSPAERGKALKKGHWVVDGLLGTGLSGEVRGWIREAIAEINASGKQVLAIDIPSGLSADTGRPLGDAVRAAVTVCLGAAKLGCVLHPGAEYAGRVEVVDIGIPPKAYEKGGLNCYLLGPDLFRAALKSRPKDAHKKDFGQVLVVAGSLRMPGAGFLASKAALRAGAGTVTYALPENAYQKFDTAHAEVMMAPFPPSLKGFEKLWEKKSAVCLGPGLGRGPETISMVRALIEKTPLPTVIDADALFALSKDLTILPRRKWPAILTPHHGEMGYLLGIEPEAVEADRVGVAQKFAKEWNCILVLKGYRSLIALPDGSMYVNPTGNPGMATAGTGDILAGAIAGFLAQGIPADKATLAGVYLHGLAGDMAREERGEKGMVAGDVSNFLPKAIRRVEAPG